MPVAKYDKEQIKLTESELNHPEEPTVNLDKVSHLIKELKFQGNDVVERPKYLIRQMQDCKIFLMRVQLEVSTRKVVLRIETLCKSEMTLFLAQLISCKTHRTRSIC